MVSCCCYSVNSVAVSFSPNKPLALSRNQLHLTSSSRFTSPQSEVRFQSLYLNRNLTRTQFVESRASPSLLQVIASREKAEPLRVMISGAPASGKGTQCELIIKKYDLVHIAAGDLLRAEVASGTVNGKKAKEYMERGQLVPNEIVATMVKERLLQQDSQEKGWLLDGYPRSALQAAALSGFNPDIFILLDVPEDILVERVVGRRLDPVTGKIYHLKFSPPETEEISARLTQRFDDTEEKVKLRLLTHNENVESVLSTYKDILVKVDGSCSKQDVFAAVDRALTKITEQRHGQLGSLAV